MNGRKWKPAGRGRPWFWLPCLAVVVVLLGVGVGDALAQSGFDTNKTMEEAKGVGTVLLAIVFLAYIVVGGIVILSALASARERGQWSHFLIALGAVIVAGFVLWSLTTMTGHSPQKITEKIQIK